MQYSNIVYSNHVELNLHNFIKHFPYQNDILEYYLRFHNLLFHTLLIVFNINNYTIRNVHDIVIEHISLLNSKCIYYT